MKNFFVIIIILFSITIISCKKDNSTAAPTEQFLSGITEKRYLPEDSATIQSQLDQDGVILVAKSSKSLIRKGYKENDETNRLIAKLHYYRLFTYNTSNQLIKITSVDESERQFPASTDTLIYKNGNVVRRELTNSKLNADGDLTVGYPLWLTKRSYNYDGQNRILTETDSVFICHDIPKGGPIEKIKPKFIYTTLTKNEYNSKNELINKVVTSTKDNTLTYGNGGWAFAMTNPGKAYTGTTSYNYQYDSENQVISKLAKFTDSKTNQTYNSIFTYSYH